MNRINTSLTCATLAIAGLLARDRLRLRAISPGGALDRIYHLRLTFISAPERMERLACSSVAEAMSHARGLIRRDETLVDVVILDGDAPIATISRRERRGC